MTIFGGYGPGKGTWKTRRYRADGTVLEDAAKPEKPRAAALHIRFRPHIDHQVALNIAERFGLKRTKTRGTVIETEKQLNEILAFERAQGRDVGWKDFDYKEPK